MEVQHDKCRDMWHGTATVSGPVGIVQARRREGTHSCVDMVSMGIVNTQSMAPAAPPAASVRQPPLSFVDVIFEITRINLPAEPQRRPVR